MKTKKQIMALKMNLSAKINSPNEDYFGLSLENFIAND